MALEQVFDCPRTISRFRAGPLGGFMDGFCFDLVDRGFSRHTVRRHIGNVAHLNACLCTQGVCDATLQARDVEAFYEVYPKVARHRGSLAAHMAAVRYAVNRFIAYLRLRGFYEEESREASAFEPLLREYVKWLKVDCGCAAGTIELRTRSIQRFLEDLGPLAAQCDCWTAERVTAFFLHYAQAAGRSARRQMQAALRTFMRFCRQRGYIDLPLDLAVPSLRTYRLASVPRGFSDAQARAVLGCIDRKTPIGCRDYAMCLLLYTYGVRGGQVRELRIEDLDWAGDRIRFRALKHGKESVLPLTKEVGRSLYQYLQQRPSHSYRRIFLSSRAPFVPLVLSSSLSNRVATYLDRAGIEHGPRGSHAFRHGFATRKLAEGHTLKSIADVLGHRHLDTTFIYTKVDFAQLEQAALPWPGGGR